MKRDTTHRTGKPLLTFIITCVLISSTTPTWAKTYRWVDEQGNTVYSQTPPPTGKFQELKLRKDISEDQRAAAINNLKEMQQQTDKARRLRNEEMEKRKKQEKSMAIKKKNCADARDNLAVLKNPHIRLLKDEEGNYETLDDKRRKTLTKEAKEQILEFCNNQTSK